MIGDVAHQDEVVRTLEKALEQEPQLVEFLENDEEAQEIWEMALKLEGVCRNAGKHAGGVVIAPSDLIDFAPLYCEAGGNNRVTQFDKDDVEAVGLVKFDFLGLRTLTIIDRAVRVANQRLEKQGKKPIDVRAIEMDDKRAFDLLKAGDTTSVFQVESPGMRRLIKADSRLTCPATLVHSWASSTAQFPPGSTH